MKFSLRNIGSLPRFVAAITPQQYDENALTPEQCVKVVQQSQVRARGWYFPHIDRERISMGPRNEYAMGAVDEHRHHLEEWRMHRTGQFLFRMKLWEEGETAVQTRMRDEAARLHDGSRGFENIPGFVAFVMLIYSVSEAYLFASRLAQAVPYRTAVDITVGLRGVQGLALGSLDPFVEFDELHITQIDKPEHKATLQLDDLVANPLQPAVSAARALFQQFGWLEPSAAVIAGWQRETFH